MFVGKGGGMAQVELHIAMGGKRKRYKNTVRRSVDETRKGGVYSRICQNTYYWCRGGGGRTRKKMNGAEGMMTSCQRRGYCIDSTSVPLIAGKRRGKKKGEKWLNQPG